MAIRYSDFIKMQNFLPVYDMADEKPDVWRTFIPTRQFCDLLSRSVTAITSKEISKRRSMWVYGTFGTGKSHASSVVRHLLCDPANDVEDYIHNIPDDSLKANLLAIRKQKNYFPVVLKGVEGAYNIPRFSLSIQKQVKTALTAAGYKNVVVQSDFDKAYRWVEGHKNRIQELIELSDELASEAPTYEKLLAKLKMQDIDVFLHLEKVLAADDTYLTSDSISDWLVEVEKKIEEAGIANGLIVFWDEFTSVMDTLKSDRINVLQNIAEKSQNNNVFLYLISHRDEHQSHDTKEKDITKMRDRFDNVEYSMDEVSTYLILRHTYTVTDKSQWGMTAYEVAQKLDTTLYEHLCEGGSPEEREHIHNLFPLHPYTAFLCSRMSNIMGSANRSILKFMNDDKNGFKAFINDDNNYSQKMMLTADWLWDFFYSDFSKDPQFTTIISTYTNYIGRVAKMSDDYVRVFKVILLLNILVVKMKDSGIKFDDEEYNPKTKKIGLKEDTITLVLSGDRCSNKIKDILDWFNESKIVQKGHFNEYKVSASTFDSSELNKQKAQIELKYKMAENYLRYNLQSVSDLEGYFKVGATLIRKCTPQFYSCEDSEGAIRSKLNKYTREYPNQLHVAIFLSVTEDSRDMMLVRVKEFSSEFADTIMILVKEELGAKFQSQFIDALGQASLSRSKFNINEASQYEKVAQEYISKWGENIKAGNCLLYFNGEGHEENFGKLPTKINRIYSAQVFPKGMETIQSILDSPITFFANENYKKLCLQVLQKQTRDDLLSIFGSGNSSSAPAKKIFNEGPNSLIDDSCQLTSVALGSNSWLVSICNEVDRLMAAAKKKYADRFSLGDVLAPLYRPPFGMFKNQANYIALAFALRKYKEELYNPSTSQPIGDEALQVMITILFDKVWDKGASESSKDLLLRFGSVEERNLTSLIGEIFNLSIVKGVSMSDLKSLTYAKWSIGEFCIQVTRYPLWSLLYCNKIKEKPSCAEAIRNLINLFSQDSYSLDKIKTLLHEMRNNQIDLYKLLANSGPIAHFAGFDLTQMPIFTSVSRVSNISEHKSTVENAQ